MQVRCCAKINLFLNIVRKLESGYHEIESIFQNVSLFDTLTIDPADTYSLEISPKSTVPVESPDHDLSRGNILERVYRHFEISYRIDPVRITLEKHIPIGAGLGGGSSDAAGLIQGLSKLMKIEMSADEALDLAKSFGADVPFFLNGGSARVTGIGECISKMQIKQDLYFTLIYPDAFISTKEAYSWVIPEGQSQNFDLFTDALKTGNMSLSDIAKLMHNSFQEKAGQYYPRVAEALRALRLYSPAVMMSGSGSAVFAVFDQAGTAKKCEEALRRSYPKCFAVKMVEEGCELIA
jgi:4-diphosphocytidyl-2-C-methyl-D-erythritol kinase